MKLPNLFYSFRARLVLVLVALLIATLGVQYYLNRRAAQRVAVTIAQQEQALAASIGLALESINSTKYLSEIDKEHKSSLLQEHAGRVMNILVVNAEGRIDDSLNPRLRPETLDDGTVRYHQISEVRLPKVVESSQAGAEIRQLVPTLPPPAPPVAGEPRAFPIRVKTNEGVNYIIVVLGSRTMPGSASRWEVARTLLPTLAVLLVATLAAAFLVWRFTRPIKGLSDAAGRIAGGDFDFRVPAANRRDEMGTLADNFNEMITRLGRTRELETRLNQAERSAVVGRLASAIAHEIRNPLNYINLTLDHLRTSLMPEDATKRAVVNRLTDQLKAEVARINTRITEFLKYTRPASLNLRPLDLRATVADALSMVEVQATESGIETRIEQQGDVPLVHGDAESLRSVFTNLIINGLQAIEGIDGDAHSSDGHNGSDGHAASVGGAVGAVGASEVGHESSEGDARRGQLIIRLSSVDGTARVEIEDNGRGIAPENLSQIFEPYFSTKETGTGLGLAIVKKAVEDHGGAISVESRPNEGTTFRVELPIQNSDE